MGSLAARGDLMAPQCSAPRAFLFPRALVAALLRTPPAVPVDEYQTEREDVEQPPSGLEELEPLRQDRPRTPHQHRVARAHSAKGPGRLPAPRPLRKSRSPASTESSSSDSS